MGRKRLLTILAGVVAAVGLQLGPAAALDVETDVRDAEVKASVSTDDVEGKVGDAATADDADDADDENDADGERKASAKVSADDGVEATAGDTEVTSKDVTEPVEEPTAGGGEPEGPSPTPKQGPTSGDGDGGPASGSDDSGSDEEVTTAGRAETFDQANGGRPGSLDPEQARQFLAGSRDPIGRDGGGVTPAFDLSGSRFGDLDDPMVAAPSDTATETEYDWESASPETAPRRSDAELAAIPAPSPDDVPVGLKLVAAMLVAGTGTLWHLTRRELQPSRA